MTVKQLIKKMKRNAESFANSGDLDKAFACIAISEKLETEDFSMIKGHINLST